MTQHLLHAFAGDKAVGQLAFDPRASRYGFEYDPVWLRRWAAYPLSLAHARDGKRTGSAVVQSHLDNLLPEGRARDDAARFFRVTSDNTFALLLQLGNELAGAVEFLALDATPEEAARAAHARRQDATRRPIADEELSQRIRERDTTPFAVWDGLFWLSLAGAQDKLQVLVEGDEISLAGGTLSSTHILKPEARNAATPQLVANEHFCMSLAASMGLPVAPVAIRRVPEPILMVERFDRAVHWHTDAPHRAQAVERLHVIDACQALGVPSSLKYQSGGQSMSFEQLFALDWFLADGFPRGRAAARTTMLRWALLQLLIGNTDAHGKNLSFFLDHRGLFPAPFYDLVSTRVYGHALPREMAMAYGHAFIAEEVVPQDLVVFAQSTGTRIQEVVDEMTALALRARNLAPLLARSPAYAADERDLVHRIADYVCVKADWMLRLALEVSVLSVQSA